MELFDEIPWKLAFADLYKRECNMIKGRYLETELTQFRDVHTILELERNRVLLCEPNQLVAFDLNSGKAACFALDLRCSEAVLFGEDLVGLCCTSFVVVFSLKEFRVVSKFAASFPVLIGTPGYPLGVGCADSTVTVVAVTGDVLFTASVPPLAAVAPPPALLLVPTLPQTAVVCGVWVTATLLLVGTKEGQLALFRADQSAAAPLCSVSIAAALGFDGPASAAALPLVATSIVVAASSVRAGLAYAWVRDARGQHASIIEIDLCLPAVEAAAASGTVATAAAGSISPPQQSPLQILLTQRFHLSVSAPAALFAMLLPHPGAPLLFVLADNTVFACVLPSDREDDWLAKLHFATDRASSCLSSHAGHADSRSERDPSVVRLATARHTLVHVGSPLADNVLVLAEAYGGTRLLCLNRANEWIHSSPPHGKGDSFGTDREQPTAPRSAAGTASPADAAVTVGAREEDRTDSVCARLEGVPIATDRGSRALLFVDGRLLVARSHALVVYDFR